MPLGDFAAQPVGELAMERSILPAVQHGTSQPPRRSKPSHRLTYPVDWTISAATARRNGVQSAGDEWF
jgi:hypothetical protein